MIRTRKRGHLSRWMLMGLLLTASLESAAIKGVVVLSEIILMIPSVKAQKLSGLDKITDYAEGGEQVPTVKDYDLADVSGVDAGNVKQMNKYLETVSSSEISSTKKLQKFIDKMLYKIAEKNIVNYAKKSSTKSPTIEDYRTLGTRCVNYDNIDIVNQALQDETYYDVKDAFFIQQVAYDANKVKNIILDNDAFDPDWVIMLSATMGMEKNCETHTLGVVTTGRDLNRRQGLAYSTILHHYGRQEIPIGLNSRQSMRSYYIDATSPNPKHIDYRGDYTSIDQFPSDGCLDYGVCNGRNESTGMLCTLLSNVKRKVTWVIGGHMHNIANLLRETSLCNGKELVSQKVDKIVISSGWKSRTSGEVEMNFSEGTTSPNTAADATKYLFANRPANVEIVIATVPNAGMNESRVGDIFRRDRFQNTPMAYILSVPRYGVYGDHGLSDTEALMYGVRGGFTKSGVQYAQKISTCFHVNSHGAVTVGSPCGKKDYYLEKNTADYMKYIDTDIYQLLNQ